MKKIGDLMEELGFNKNSPDSAKEAFIRHLIKTAVGVEVQPRNVPKNEKVSNEDNSQLSFLFDENLPSKKAI